MKKFLSFLNVKRCILLLKITVVSALIALAVLTKPNVAPGKVAVLYICTGRYIYFWDGFYETMKKNFLPDYQKTYFVFTDDTEKVFPPNVVKIHQEQMPWPLITLLRYHFFQKIIPQLQQYDYVYFFNANTRLLQRIGSEILPSEEQGIAVAKHTDFLDKNLVRFPYERNKNSKAYIPDGLGEYYIRASFYGGRSKDFIQLTNTIVSYTNHDLKNGIIPIWHDESYLNRYLVDYMKEKTPLVLDERYTVYEEYRNIADPILLLLDKDGLGGRWYFRSTNYKKTQK